MASASAQRRRPRWSRSCSNSSTRDLAIGGPQRSIAFTHEGDHLVSDSIRNCSFIPLRGLLAASAPRLPLDVDGGLVLTSTIEPLPLSPDAVAALLRAPLQPVESGVRT